MERIRIKNLNSQSISVGNAHKIVIGSDPYEGEYVLSPSWEEQRLPTKNKVLHENIIVEKIEMTETSNESGGLTLAI